jgi:diguanylate cyclase (GGDEF)-like protein
LSDGRKHWVHNEVRFMTDVDSGHACAMLLAKNIDKEKIEEQKLVMAAKMDKMTMVLNRDTTMEYIRQIFERDSTNKHALFMIDIDNFKALNDTFGHQVGDEFLIEFAAKLKKSFRDTDIVGRVGGDEFFALMRNVSDKVTIENKAADLLRTVQSICSDYEKISLSGSIGIAVYPECGKSIEALYLRADTALYQAKREGKNRYVFLKNRWECLYGTFRTLCGGDRRETSVSGP